MAILSPMATFGQLAAEGTGGAELHQDAAAWPAGIRQWRFLIIATRRG